MELYPFFYLKKRKEKSSYLTGICYIFGVGTVGLDLSLSQIIFDECHKAKNASSTKIGKAVLDLQNKLPQARVVYASATGILTHLQTNKRTHLCM